MTFYLFLSEKVHFSVNFATAGEARGFDDVFWCSKIYCSVVKTEQLSFLPESSFSQLELGGLFFLVVLGIPPVPLERHPLIYSPQLMFPPVGIPPCSKVECSHYCTTQKSPDGISPRQHFLPLANPASAVSLDFISLDFPIVGFSICWLLPKEAKPPDAGVEPTGSCAQAERLSHCATRPHGQVGRSAFIYSPYIYPSAVRSTEILQLQTTLPLWE